VALSMEEQRMLDEMERQLAIDDPRLASRFNAFGRPRLPGALTSRRAKVISGVLAVLLIGAVTVMMFVVSPYSGRHDAPRTLPSAAAKAHRSASSATASSS